jgi:hypothetical protein
MNTRPPFRAFVFETLDVRSCPQRTWKQVVFAHTAEDAIALWNYEHNGERALRVRPATERDREDVFRWALSRGVYTHELDVHFPVLPPERNGERA